MPPGSYSAFFRLLLGHCRRCRANGARVQAVVTAVTLEKTNPYSREPCSGPPQSPRRRGQSPQIRPRLRRNRSRRPRAAPSSRRAAFHSRWLTRRRRRRRLSQCFLACHMRHQHLGRCNRRRCTHRRRSPPRDRARRLKPTPHTRPTRSGPRRATRTSTSRRRIHPRRARPPRCQRPRAPRSRGGQSPCSRRRGYRRHLVRLRRPAAPVHLLAGCATRAATITS